MANNCTQFSFVFKINSPREAEYIESILQASYAMPTGVNPEDLTPEEAEQVQLLLDIFEDFEEYECLGFDCEVTGADKEGEVWVHDDAGEGNIDYVCQFIRAYLNKFDLDTKIGFSWASTCSSPRVGEFGGGAVVVSKDDEKWLNTDQWLSEELG